MISLISKERPPYFLFTYTFDANNKVTKTDIKDPLLNLTTINYNTSGMPTSIKDPNNNTTSLLYENANRPAELTKIIDPLTNEFKIHYDSLGRIESVTDANNKTTYYTYDPFDRISSVTDPLDRLTRYFYDGNGNLVMVVDAKNNDIRYEYDDRDRLEKMIDQLGREETYTYYRDAEILTYGDNLKSITDKKGQTTTFNTYDAMNRVKKITYHDGSYTGYTYDAVGRVDYINDSISGYIDYTYNDFGCTTCTGRGMDRIAQEVTPLGTIDYTYDALGRRKSMTVAGQPTVNYEYYDNGLPEEIRRIINGIERRVDFGYDDGGRRSGLKYFQGTETTPATETTYGYDTANRLLNIQHLQSTNVLENLLYEYDANGNRTKFTRDASQTLRDDAVSPSCGITTYVFDVRNRLVGINGFNPDCSSLTASFQYDAIGRRIGKTINGETTQYVYDGLDIIQEKQNGTVTANYIRTLNIDEPLTRIKADGTVRHYVTDALGSVIALTDDSGVTKTTYTYDPFGNVTARGETSDNPFQYTGRENDGTGLYYYRARYYSPELQRFITEDPIGLAGGINQFAYVDSVGKPMTETNLYLYTGNNPVNRIDPLGLWYIDINISLGLPNFIGGTGGLVIDTETGNLHTYAGGGLVSPGLSFSVTGSSSTPTPGWTVGLQGTAGIAGQVGYSFGGGGSWFGELGGGLPIGGSLTGFYVSDPVHNRRPIEPAKCH